MRTLPQASSLAARLRRAFWLFGGFMVLLFAGVALFAALLQEDSLLRLQAETVLERHLEEHPETLTADARQPIPLHSGWFTLHPDETTLPDPFREEIAQLPPGTWNLEPRKAFAGEEYIVIVHETDGARSYFLYDVRRFDEVSEFLVSQLLVLSIGGGAVLLMGFFLAGGWSRRFFAPVSALAATIEGASEPAVLASALSDRAGDPEEVEALRQSLEASMARVDRFVQRERHFTRNASHELRTPLTVIRGAAELLVRELESPRERARVGRIQRAVADMEELIAAFLYLAREELSTEHEDPIDLDTSIQRVVDANRHVLGDRAVEVQVEISEPVEIRLPEQVFSILLSNLVRNAFQSTAEGDVKIAVESGRIAVLDTGAGVSDVDSPEAIATAPGRGFGLLIVRELCDRIGWSLRLGNREERGAVAELTWNIAEHIGKNIRKDRRKAQNIEKNRER